MSVASQVDILTATILINASLSDVLDVGGHKLAAIIMPAAWTTAGLSVVGCDTASGTFLPVYDDLGTEITITAAASRIISIDSVAGSLAQLAFIKLRSGTSGSPVTQAAARTLKLLLK